MILPELPVEEFIGHYGCWAVFAIVCLESAGLPLPGEIALVSAAVVAATTHSLNITLVIAAASAGAALGGILGYWLGHEFGFRLLVQHGGRVGIHERQVKLGQYLFLRHGGKVVFFGRMVAVLRVLAAVLAGVNRMPWGRFLLCNVAGGGMWALLYGGGAFLLGQKIKEIAGPAGFSALALGAVLVVFGLRYIRHHQRALEERAEQALPGPLVHPRR